MVSTRTTRMIAAAVVALLTGCAIGPGCARKAQVPVSLRAELIQLDMKGRKVTIEVARTFSSRKRGLMFRESLPEDRGMLFVYPEPDKLSFWMENTKVPLSIAFVDDHGKILQIEDMRPLDRGSVPSKYEVRYALEMNQGWFERAGVAVGDTLEGFERKVQWYLQRAE